MEKNKIVYFLGAGFSKDAGGPIQNEILQNLFSDGFYDNASKVTRNKLDQFKKFLRLELLVPEEKLSLVSLEDVFTPIDRSIMEAKSFGHYSYKELINIRRDFHNLLAQSIQYGVNSKDAEDKTYITSFAKYINKLARQRVESPLSDCVAVITTNWDILLDQAFFELTKEESEKFIKESRKNGLSKEKYPLAVVDYCCHISSLENDRFIKPGLLAIGRGGYNIKYLKLHGSMNWLHCPYCQRMYVKFDQSTMFSKHYCKHCRDNFQLSNMDSIRLRANLLLPTFLKDYSNIQIQLVWQNAAMELSEAKKVVFMGYSLPSADFEIRQMLSRYIAPTTDIEVVLYPGKETSGEAEQYKTFFGTRNTQIIYKRIPEYIDGLK